MNKDFLILIPSYEPTQSLNKLVCSLSSLNYQILIVDDGSGHNFQKIFDECSSYASILSYSKNKGKGEALKYGFRYILDNYKDVKYVLTVDGDGQHCLDDIVMMSKEIKEKNKIVIGERLFLGKIPIKSKIGNSLSKFSQGLCTYRYMKDNQCGLRAFPVSYLPLLIKIKGSRYEYEMMVLNHLQMKEIPYVGMDVSALYEDNNSSTHFRPIKDTLLIQGSILIYGLINLLSFVFGFISALLFYKFLFSEGAVLANPLSYELATFLASPIAFIFQFILTLIIFKPVRVSRMTFRLVLIKILMLISEIITVSFFVRICMFNFVGAYIICLPLVLLPLYYLIKGISLVYSANE